MIVRGLAFLAVGVVGLLALAALSQWAAQTVWPSYLAAWMAVSTLPLGALVLVMSRDFLGAPETQVSALSRAFLPAMPLAALLALPMLLWRDRFYALPDLKAGAFAASWMAPSATLTRGIVILMVWVVLAFLFRRPPAAHGGRTALAALGLCLHVVTVTLAASDWVGAADRTLASSSQGLTVLVAQAGAALAVASLLVPSIRGDRHMPPGSIALMILFAAWLFLQFAQYLVVWSANLPAEATWYLRRAGVVGDTVEIGAFLVLAIGVAGFLPIIGGRLVRLFEGLVLLIIAASMFWLIVPGSRGDVSLHLADIAALAGLAGLVGGLVLLLWRAPLRGEEAAHGAA